MASAVPTQVSGADGLALSLVSVDAPAAVLLVDLDSRSVVYANPVAVQLAPGVGLPVGLEVWSDAAQLRDVDGDELSETTHPLTLVARSQPVAGQAVSAARATAMGRNRQPLWVVAVPMHDAPHLDGHALVVLLPLSQREAAQAAATAAAAQVELRDRAVLATGMAFTLADARADDLPLIWVNPAFTANTGYSFDQAVGRNCRFLQGPATDPATVRTMRERLAAGEQVTVTVLNYRADGTVFWNQVAMSPIHDPDGLLTHFVGIQTDVTARVTADAERDAALAAEQVARAEAEAARAEAEAARAEAEAARAEAEASRAEAETAHAQMGVLADATSALAATLDVGECLSRLSRLLVPMLADWVVLATSDGRGRLDHLTTCHRDGRTQEMSRYAQLLATTATPASALHQVLEGAPARLVGEYTSARRRAERASWVQDTAVLDLAEQLGAASVMFVPLPGREQVDGVMVLARGPGSPAHTSEDLAMAGDLGRRAGLVLDNARLYQREHRIAEALQRSLLPELPRIEGVSAAARYRASASGAAVGGDFYELIELPRGGIALAVGDVMGHDVMAAAAMGHLRGLLRACAFDTDRPSPPGDRRSRPVQDPADVLDRVDQLVQGLDIATLATVAYARLEPLDAPVDGQRSWRIHYASAGHPPLLVRHADGTVKVLDDADGLLLGVQASPRTSASCLLAAGSTVLAYTDGLIERRGGDLTSGLADLVAAFTAAPRDVQALVDHLLEALGDSHDIAHQDDVAILAIRL